MELSTIYENIRFGPDKELDVSGLPHPMYEYFINADNKIKTINNRSVI